MKNTIFTLAFAASALAASAAGNNVRLQGAMVHNDQWAEQDADGKFIYPMNPGAYVVSAKPGGPVTMLQRVNDFYQIRAAINSNGIFYALTEQGEEGQYYLQSFSASTWTRISKEEIDKCNMACDLTYDPVSRKYYGFFWSDTTQEYTRFCSWSPVYGEATDIREDMDRNCFAIAANKEGEIYGIWGYTGWLVKVNPGTGEYEQIGTTGVCPGENTNSLCFDDETGKLYWTACEERNRQGVVTRKAGIYEINLTTGKATLLRDFDNSESFAGMWVLPYEMGDDVPMAPTDVRVTTDSHNHTLSWKAPTKLRNGAELDPATLTYRIVNTVNGQEMVSGYSGTSWEYPYPPVDGHAAYQYMVYASNENGEGEGALSNKYYDGPGYHIPFEENFDTLEDFNYWSVVDLNGANTWQYNADKKNIFSHYDENNTAADDWIFSMPFSLEAGHTYELSFDASCDYDSRDKYAEDFEFWLAKGNEPSLKTERIARFDKFLSAEVQHKRVIFTASETAWTWLGIYTDSPGTHWSLNLDNIGIREISDNVPASVTDLSLSAGEAGALTARLAWKNPETGANGEALTENLTIHIYRDNDTEPLHSIVDAAPGAAMEWTDTPSASGIRTYRVAAENVAGTGAESECAGFIGIDAPGAPRNLAVTEMSDAVELHWDAPEVGEHGGWFDASGVSYRIVRSDGTVLSTDCEDTSFTDNNIDLSKQELLYYLVTSYVGTQKGGWANSPYEVYGRAYDAPLAETFPQAGLKWYPWISESDGPRYLWGLEEVGVNPECDDQNGDHGLVMMTSSDENAGVTGTFASPKVNTSTLTKPRIGFWLWHSPAGNADKNEQLSVYVRLQGGDWTLINEEPILRDNATAGWMRHTLPLPKADALRVMFSAKALGGGNIHLDNISFEEDVPQGCVGIESDSSLPVEWFSIQGVRIDAPAEPGVYIMRRGNETRKVIL